MTRLLYFCSLLFLTNASLCAQNLAQQLGYPADAKLLILHADDLGVSHSENHASFTALEKGPVNSASIMVPCPWFMEVVDWAQNHPDADLGLHLTLTAEWKHIKWGPVASSDKVPGLLNEQGYFYDNVADVIAHAKEQEVELELRAQIEKSLKAGLKPTHLDSHMGSLFNPKFFGIYLKLGQEYNIPVMITNQALGLLPEGEELPKNSIIVDQVYVASPDDFKMGMEQYYSTVIKSLTPGVHVILMHLAYDNQEMQAVAIDHPDYGAGWRQQDFDFFTSKRLQDLLQQENIKMVTWRELAGLMK